MKIKVPKPPAHYGKIHSLIQDGMAVAYIWYFDEVGRTTIETLYETAHSLALTSGLSKATIYRIMAKEQKRYWIIDYRNPKEASCVMGIPKEIFRKYEPRGVGNPNFSNGIYQQSIARKRKRYKPGELSVDFFTN